MPESDVDDVLQDVYVSVYQNIGRLRDPRAALAWIKSTAFRRSVNFLTRTHDEVMAEEDTQDWLARNEASAEAEIGDVKLAYYTEGDDAVYVTDGPVYSGTTEQFGLDFSDGVHTYLKGIIGEPGVLVDCASNVEKTEEDELTLYTLTLDIDKYTATDEALQYWAEAGNPLSDALITVGFSKDGSICSIDKKLEYKDIVALWSLVLSDHDNTVVDPMPAATKTYEEMEADMAEKFEEAFADEEPADTAESN